MLQFLHQAQSLLSINTLPFAERDMILQNAAAQREAKAQFDKSRLVDLSEHVLLDCPAAQVYIYQVSYGLKMVYLDHLVSCLVLVRMFAFIQDVIACRRHKKYLCHYPSLDR